MRAPSKKVSAVFLLTVIGVITVMLVNNRPGQRTTTYNPEQIKFAPPVTTQISDTANEDADADGLTTWEEALWKTDPNNPDSDGDGTPDETEVTQDRNPTVPSPNDFNSNIDETLLALAEQRSGGTQNLTDKTLTSLIENYFILRQNGELSPELKQQLIDRVFTEAMQNTAELSYPYGEDDFVTISVLPSDPQVLIYANAVIQLHKSMTVGIQLLSIPGADQNKIPPLLEETTQQLLQIVVPDLFLVDHVYLTNHMDQYATLVRNLLRQDQEDPLYTLINVRLFNDVGLQIKTRFKNIYAAVQQSGILYDESSGLFVKP